MRIERSPEGLTIAVPAKLNLYLAVGPRRADGYHEIATLMCPVSLFDEVTIAPLDDSAIRFHLDVVGDATSVASERFHAFLEHSVPTDEQNLCVQAARLVQQRLGIRQGCSIHLRKRIPVMAGMGGGSGDAAAAVVGCMLLWDAWDRREAIQICQNLGSDVPFYLGDEHRIGWAWATGRGERIEMLPGAPSLQFSVTAVAAGLPTRDVYDRYRHADENWAKVSDILRQCQNGQLKNIGANLRNDLQSPARQLSDWVELQLALFQRAGFRYAQMTGSGISCFGIVENDDQRARLCQLAAQHDVTTYDVSAWTIASVEDQIASL